MESYNNFNLNPLFNIQLSKNISTNAFSHDDNKLTCLIFQSINNIFYLVFLNDKNGSIIFYDIDDNRKICEIKSDEKIVNIIYYLDTLNKRDLIAEVSSNNLKLWDANILEPILSLLIYHINLDSICFSKYNNENQIITIGRDRESTYYGDKFQLIKVFNLKGDKIKEIELSSIDKIRKEELYLIETYYDTKLEKYFLILYQNKSILSYDYQNNKPFLKYKSRNISNYEYSDDKPELLINNNKDKITKIIRLGKSYIFIWNFHSGKLENKININNGEINNFCLWNDKYLFISLLDINMNLMDIKSKNGLFSKVFYTNKDFIIAIKKINHKKYGECLISIGYDFNEEENEEKKINIKLWSNKKI